MTTGFSDTDLLNFIPPKAPAAGTPSVETLNKLKAVVETYKEDDVKKNMNISLNKGNLTRGELVEKYAQMTTLSIDNITFYYVFGLFKIAVIIQQIFFRSVHRV